MKYQREHNYDLTATEEPLYKEVIFETSEAERKNNIVIRENPIRKQKTVRIRNYDEFAAESLDIAELPRHPEIKQKVANKFEFYNDPFKYLENPSEEQLKNFEVQELGYYKNLNVKQSFLQETFKREYQNRHRIADLIPTIKGDYMYYRNSTNPSDFLTLYRYPVKHVKQEDRGKIPTEDLDKYEQVVFSVKDLIHFYDNYALKNPEIKSFVENMNEIATIGGYDPYYWFTTNIKGDIGALVFDINKDGTYHIILKDMKANILLPTLLSRTNGQIAFDSFDRMYYVIQS